jgi:hypothetical protein
MGNKLKLNPTNVYKYFWEFAYYRDRIFFDRLKNPRQQSENKILAEYKFTNIYRILDRTTQYLVKKIVNNDKNYTDLDLLFRILLFKIFNRIETWESIESILGDINWSNFSIDIYVQAFEKISTQRSLYSAAYIMPTKIGDYNYKKKYKNHLHLLKDIMNDSLLENIKRCNSLKDVYETLLDIPSFGKFLAYQFTIDINYSRLIDFDENEFVVAGPGAVRGIEKAFENHKKFDAADIIRWLTENQKEEMNRLGYKEFGLKSRELKLIDIQNILCEFDKYTRVDMIKLEKNIIEFNKGTRIKQYFKPNKSSIDYVFPKKWGRINVDK